MDSRAYNQYLAAIKAANDYEYSRSKEMLRRIYSDMVAQYGASDSDVQYLYRQFAHNI